LAQFLLIRLASIDGHAADPRAFHRVEQVVEHCAAQHHLSRKEPMGPLRTSVNRDIVV
jgi:hypothetical protein